MRTDLLRIANIVFLTSFCCTGLAQAQTALFNADTIGYFWTDTNGYGNWTVNASGTDSYQGGVNDPTLSFGLSGDQPVVGNWYGPFLAPLAIGVFRNGYWYLDWNDNGKWDSGIDDSSIPAFGLPGDIPVIGDWNHDGHLRIGVARIVNNLLWWFVQTGCANGANICSYDPNYTATFQWGQPGDIPVVGDWDQSGHLRIGIFRGGSWIANLATCQGDVVSCNGYPGSTPHNYGEPISFSFAGSSNGVPVVGDWGTGYLGVGGFSSGSWSAVTSPAYNGAYLYPSSYWSYGQSGDVPKVGAWKKTFPPNAPVWTPVTLGNYYSYMNSQPPQPQNTNGNQTYQYYISSSQCGGDGKTIDYYTPGGGPSPDGISPTTQWWSATTINPSPYYPWWWGNCDGNGNCTAPLTNTPEYSYDPEARNSYAVLPTPATQIPYFFRGFQFYGQFSSAISQANVSWAVFFSDATDFSGGFEYGFVSNNYTPPGGQYHPVLFYAQLNANCPGLGSSTLCKAANSGTSATMVTQQSMPDVPLPAGLSANQNYYFMAYIFWDSTLFKYRFKVDVLDSSFNSLCTGSEPCASPIDSSIIPRAYSWGTVWASAATICGESGPTPTGPVLTMNNISVGK